MTFASQLATDHDYWKASETPVVQAQAKVERLIATEILETDEELNVRQFQERLVERKVASSQRVAERISTKLRKRWCEEHQIVERPGRNNSKLIRLATSADQAAEAAEGAAQ